MPAIASPTLLGAGALAFLIGLWLWRWSSRNAIDVKGAAIGAAWQAARKREMPSVPQDLKHKLQEIAAHKSHAGKAAKAGTTVARHFIAQVFGIVGLIGILGGLALMAAGIFWK
jgi:hypothetical protein